MTVAESEFKVTCDISHWLTWLAKIWKFSVSFALDGINT